MLSSPQPRTNFPSEPFQRKPWQVRLEDEVNDLDYTQRDGSRGEGKVGLPAPGALRFESSWKGDGIYTNIRCHGPCWFKWGANRSGSTFTVGQLARKVANSTFTQDEGTTGVTDSVSTFTDEAAFVANEEVGNILYILDDAGAAGAAPEGEWAAIIKNDADTLTLQPALTVAPAVGDTAVIKRIASLTLLGGAIEREETFGVTVRASGVQDNFWGWFCCKGLVEAAIVAAGTAITVGEGLIGIAGGLLTTGLATSGQDIMLARSVSAHTSDTVKRIVPVSFDVLDGLPFTGVT